MARSKTVKLSDILAQVDVQPKGEDQWQGLCPAHDDNRPSFTMSVTVTDDNEDKLNLHCFAGCTIDDLCEALGITKADLYRIELDDPSAGRTAKRPAVKKSAHNLSAEDLAYVHQLVHDGQRDGEGLDRLADRCGLGKIDIMRWSLGVNPDGRVIIPCFDTEGVIKGVRLRDTRPDADPAKKELALPAPGTEGARWLPYTYRPAARKLYPELVVTEGPIDGLTASSAGYDVFAVLGVSNGKAREVREDLVAVARGRTVVVVGDNDKAGREFSEDLAQHLRDNRVTVVVVTPPGDGNDLNDWYLADPELFDPDLRHAIEAPGGESVEDPAALLDEVREFLRRFMFLPDLRWFDVMALWVANTYVLRHSNAQVYAPRLGLISGDPGSGKTLITDILAALCGTDTDTMLTAAAFVRRLNGLDAPDGVEVATPVPVFIDEIDNIYADRKANAGELTGYLNSGYKVTGKTMKADKEDQKKLISYSVFGPVAFNGLGDAELPNALVTRTFLISLQKARKGEIPERYSPLRHGKEARVLAERLDRWARSSCDDELITDILFQLDRELSEFLVNRQIDLWSSIGVVAELVGGEWPARHRDAAKAFKSAGTVRTETDASRLLRVAKTAYERVTRQEIEVDLTIHQLRSEGLINEKAIARDALVRLANEYESYFAVWRGSTGVHDEDVRRILVKSYGLEPKTVRTGGPKPVRGYRWADLEELWTRNLAEDPEVDEAGV